MRVLLVAIAALTFGVAGLAAACGDDDTGDGRLRVVATTAVIQALAREVGGDEIELSVMAGAGVDPHDYEATPSDVRRVADADVVLRNGLGFDDFLDSVIDNAGGNARVVTVTEGIEPIEHEEDDHEAEEGPEDENGHEDDDAHDHLEDPHVWHDPDNVKVMVANIAAALAELDPDNAATYQQRATAYAARMDEVDTEIRALIEEIPAENRKMVTNHGGFGYFIARYGLELIGTVIPGVTTDAEPSARQLAELSDLIRSEGVKAIFAESSIDPRVARQLANDTGVTIVDDLYGDTLGEPGSGAETVDAMLLSNARKISEALR